MGEDDFLQRKKGEHYLPPDNYKQLNALLKQIYAGDKSAEQEFSNIAKPFIDKITQNLTKRTEGAVDAEYLHDVVTKSFLYALNKARSREFCWQEFSSCMNFYMRNPLTQAIRRSERDPQIAARYLRAGNQYDNESPDNILMEKEDQARFMEAVKVLSKKWRWREDEMMRRIIFEGKCWVEAAEGFDITRGRAQQIVAECAAEIKSYLRERGYNEDAANDQLREALENGQIALRQKDEHITFAKTGNVLLPYRSYVVILHDEKPSAKWVSYTTDPYSSAVPWPNSVRVAAPKGVAVQEVEDGIKEKLGDDWRNRVLREFSLKTETPDASITEGYFLS